MAIQNIPLSDATKVVFDGKPVSEIVLDGISIWIEPLPQPTPTPNRTHQLPTTQCHTHTHTRTDNGAAAHKLTHRDTTAHGHRPARPDTPNNSHTTDNAQSSAMPTPAP